MVSRLSPEYGQLFHYIGLHRDKHVREHEVYEVQLAPGRPGGAGDIPPAAESSTGSSAGTDRPTPFEPVLLARLTAALAREIGPVAKLVVRRAVEHAADERMLCAALAENVSAPGREAFLAGLADLVGGERGAATPSSATSAPPAASPGPPARAAEIGPDLLARAELLLSRHIGPLAPILVREAARHARSPRDLFERLALHINNEDVRKLFIASADQPA